MPYKNPQDHLAAQRRWYSRNKDAVRASKKRAKARKAGGREKPSVCDVCAQPSWRMVFDHCHATERFRGWLCYGCNVALGHVKDNPETLRALADYLESGMKTFKGNQTWPEGAKEQELGESLAPRQLRLVR